MSERIEHAVVELLNAAEEQVRYEYTQLHNAVVLADDIAQEFGFDIETGLDLEAGADILETLKRAYEEEAYLSGAEFLRIIMMLIGAGDAAELIGQHIRQSGYVAHCFLRRFIFFAEREIAYSLD